MADMSEKDSANFIADLADKGVFNKMFSKPKFILIKKTFSLLSYLLSAISLVILLKTELRKWFAFGGEPSSANTSIFWIALLSSIIFFYIGKKLWPRP